MRGGALVNACSRTIDCTNDTRPYLVVGDPSIVAQGAHLQQVGQGGVAGRRIRQRLAIERAATRRIDQAHLIQPAADRLDRHKARLKQTSD